MFQDRGGVGRVLTLSPCRWIDGWPMLGDEEGRVPERVRALISGEPEKHIVCSDDFSSDKLGLHWQWNHNPVNSAWSLTERPGFLRLKTARVVPNLYLAPNTLTQRMKGPKCSATVLLDLSHMKSGDRAGFCAFNDETGALMVKKEGKRLTLCATELSVKLSPRDKAVENVTEKIVEQLPLTTTKLWLRIDANFVPRTDIATFYYSLDGEHWQQMAGDYRLRFDWQRFFMGSKYALFCYATQKTGGYVDVDSFTIE
jgi:beta-xylosidase